MKPSRKAVVLALAVALTTAGCSRFAPKAGVGVNPVAVDLAFGIDVESILNTPTPTLIPPSTPTFTPPPETSSSTFVPPPTPETPVCLPPQTNTTRDGQAPVTVRNQKFKEGGADEGSRPRMGQYFTYFEYNFSGEEPGKAFDYKELKRDRPVAINDGFGFDVKDPLFGHAIDVTWVVVPESNDEQGRDDVAGIYIQRMAIPYKERAANGAPKDKREFTGFDPGIRLVNFPIQNGNKSTDTQPVPEDPDTTGEVPSFGGAASTLKITSVVGERDRVFVCDRIADAWRVSVTMEFSGDVDIRIVGNLWLAPQYGGWAIQEAFTIDGGAEFVSGNFFSRIARLDPGRVA